MKQNLFFLFGFFVFAFVLSGCIAAELAEIGAAEVGALEAGEVAMAESAGLEFGEAGAVIEDEALFSRNVSRVRLMSEPVGRNPRIGVMEGGSRVPVGEIIPEEGMIRLNNGSKIPIHHDMYIVNSENVFIKDSPYSTNARVIDQLYKDRWIFKLSEENGWYRVRYDQYKEGFIDPAFLVPVFVMGDDKRNHSKNGKDEHNKSLTSFIHDRSFLNKKNSREIALIVTDGEKPNAELTNLLKSILIQKGYNVTTTLFDNKLIYENYFDDLYDGEVEKFKSLGLNKYVDFLFLVTMPINYTGNQFQDMVSAKSSINIHVLDAATGFMIDSRTFNTAGAGFNQAQATETLNKHIKQKTESFSFNF